MNEFFRILVEIRGRVPMYVGDNSLTQLASFIRGLSFALVRFGIVEDAGSILGGFQEFVQAKYAISVSKGWEEIIVFHSYDQVEALDVFWGLIDEYLDLRQKEAHLN